MVTRPLFFICARARPTVLYCEGPCVLVSFKQEACCAVLSETPSRPFEPELPTAARAAARHAAPYYCSTHRCLILTNLILILIRHRYFQFSLDVATPTDQLTKTFLQSEKEKSGGPTSQLTRP
jgi:hypothetical protein